MKKVYFVRIKSRGLIDDKFGNREIKLIKHIKVKSVKNGPTNAKKAKLLSVYNVRIFNFYVKYSYTSTFLELKNIDLPFFAFFKVEEKCRSKAKRGNQKLANFVLHTNNEEEELHIERI